MSANFGAGDVIVVTAGKRLALTHYGHIGDWFNSYSPRNDNDNAEGPWDQWVDLAVMILQHEATRITRPEAFKATQGLATHDYYSESDRYLTDDEIAGAIK